jgi:cell shape-determining protein MreC
VSKRRVQQSLVLANRQQAKAKECERLMEENAKLHHKIRDYEQDAQMYKRLLSKRDLPTSYLMQDIEKGERKLNKAHKRNRVYVDENSKLKEENEALKKSVQGLKPDLSALITKKKEIYHLQSTLMSIVSEPGSKKVSVDSIKNKLAATAGRDEIDRTMKRVSRSRSPQKKAGKSYDLTAWYGALKQKLGH